MDDDTTFKPGPLWFYMKDITEGEYRWCKKKKLFNHNYANCYVCYHLTREIGLIPIEFEETDLEWVNWWKTQRLRGNNTVRKMMGEIIERHKRFRRTAA